MGTAASEPDQKQRKVRVAILHGSLDRPVLPFNSGNYFPVTRISTIRRFGVLTEHETLMGFIGE